MDKIDKLINKIMKKLNKLSLPAVILIASIILGGFYYTSEVNKQRSIERQQQVKLQEDKRIEEVKAEQEAEEEIEQAKIIQERQRQFAEEQEKEETSQALDDCLNETVNYYVGQMSDYCRDYTNSDDLDIWEESCGIPQRLVDRWVENQKFLRDECFKRYPQN